MFLLISNLNEEECNKFIEELKKNYILIKFLTMSHKCYILFELNMADLESINKVFNNYINIFNLIKKYHEKSIYFLVYFKEFMFEPEYIYILSTNINKIFMPIDNAFYYIIKLLLIKITFIIELGNVYLNLISDNFREIYEKCGCNLLILNQHNTKFSIQARNNIITVFFKDINGKSTFDGIFKDVLYRLIKHVKDT